MQLSNQTCQSDQDELENSTSCQNCKEQPATILSNFFAKVEGRAESDTEATAKIKFEFGAEPGLDEPSPKTPEFSEIAELNTGKTTM